MKQLTTFLLLFCLACTPRASTPATSPAAASGTATAAATLGSTRETAIEVCQPRGERAYLARLRCPDGKPAVFERTGNVGMRTAMTKPEHEEMVRQQIGGGVPPGQPDFHTLDLYKVTCGDRTTELLFDMYHCDKPAPDEAPAGFTIEPPR